MVQAGPQNQRPTDPVPGISFEIAADLSWMDKTTGWGTRAKPDFVHGGGLTVGALNIGVYSEIPDRILYRNRLPRGAYPAPGAGQNTILDCDEATFEGTGVYVLGLVLSKFMARYVSINSFVETVIRTQQRGEVARWPLTVGRRPTV